MSSRRPKNFRRPAGGPGGRSLVGWVGPGTIIQNHNYIITTVFYNLKNLNNIIDIVVFFILIQNIFKEGDNLP